MSQIQLLERLGRRVRFEEAGARATGPAAAGGRAREHVADARLVGRIVRRRVGQQRQQR